jgi:hypothetical protein
MSEPTPTEKMDAIRARHADMDHYGPHFYGTEEVWDELAATHDDRAALLAEVERLTRQAESWATVVRQSQDGWDEALRERDALAARLRGGATAPTPDPQRDARWREDVLGWLPDEVEAQYEKLYALVGGHSDADIRCALANLRNANRILRNTMTALRLRRDTGASHE